MAKRFTDNQKWSKSWFMNLTVEEKLLWIYITDSCDHAGIWEVNWKLTSFMVGFQVIKLPDNFKKQIQVISDNKYWIKDFCQFQYGTLNSNNRAHNSVINILSNYNLGAYKGLTSPLQGHKDKDKDKDKVKVKVKKDVRFKSPSLDKVINYFKKMKYPDYKNEAEKFFYFYESKGWMVGKNKMKKWHMSAGNWNKNNTATNGDSFVDLSDDKIKKERQEFFSEQRKAEERSASTEEIKDIISSFKRKLVD
tara:strand:- start:1247 stop:1996 length:750 start_codon:yes stop_codon:yes gene_type:complete